MSQDASPNPVISNTPQEEPATPPPEVFHHATRSPDSDRFSVESYADRLMDTLFQDVDQLLDRDTPPSSPPATPAPARFPERAQTPATPFPTHSPPAGLVKTSDSPQPGLPLVAQSESTPAPHSQSSSASALLVDNPTPKDLDRPLAAPAEKLQKPGGAYDRLLLGVGCVSVVVSMALWLLYQEAHRQPALTASQPQAAPSPAAEADSHFADYLQKSLQKLDQQSSQGQTVTQSASATAGTLPANPGMPTVTIPQMPAPPQTAAPGSSLFSSRPSVGLERIYVPLPSRSAVPGAYVAPLPKMPMGLRPNQSPTQAGKPKSIASGQTTATAGVVRRLAGVLDQGDRSVALFEVNGVTQRYQIGESIGSSGWTLVEVSKSQAVVRRNGEVRSVFVGQDF